MKYLNNFEMFIEAKSAEDLVDLFKISTEIEGQTFNGYAVSSTKTENTIMNFLVSAAKTRFTKNQFLFKEDSFGEGYLYSYLIYLIIQSIKKNSELMSNSRKLISEVAGNFKITKINDKSISRLEAEKIKRERISKDPDSFKTKGAAVKGSNFYKFLKKEEKEKGIIKIDKLSPEILELFEDDHLQIYPKNIIIGGEKDWIVYNEESLDYIIQKLEILNSELSEGKEKFTDEFMKYYKDKEGAELDKKNWEIGWRTVPQNTRIYNIFVNIAKKNDFGLEYDILELFKSDHIQFYKKDTKLGDKHDWIIYHKTAINDIIKNLEERNKKLSKEGKYTDEFMKYYNDKEGAKLDKKIWPRGFRSIPYNTRIYNLFDRIAKRGRYDSSQDRED